MYPEIVDSKWNNDSHITKFLDLLLKHKHQWSDEDEESTQSERLLVEYYRNFGKVSTLRDIKVQTKRIQHLYKKEALKLRRAGKNESESKLPWFSKAESLFFGTIDWEKEFKTKASSDDSSIFQSLPQTHTFSSSKIAMVSPICTSSMSPIGSTYLPLATNPFSVGNYKASAAKSFLKTKGPLPSLNSAFKSDKIWTSRSSVKEIAKFTCVNSIFTMDACPSQIPHPFYPPPSLTPAVPHIPPWTIPLTSNAASTSAQSIQPPNVISSRVGAIPAFTAVPSNHLLSTTASRVEVPLSPTATKWTIQDPCSTTITCFCNTFMTAKSTRVQFPPVSYKREVPLSSIASSYKNATLTKTAMSPDGRVLGSDDPSLTSKSSLRLYQHPPSYRESFLRSLAQPSKTRDTIGLDKNPSQYFNKTSTSAAMPSKAGYRLYPYNPPNRVEVPLDSAATSSRSNVITSTAPISINSSHIAHRQNVSRMNRLSLASKADVKESVNSPSSPSAFASAASLAGVFSYSSALTSVVPSVRESNLTSSVLSIRESIIKSAVPSSSTSVFNSVATSTSSALTSTARWQGVPLTSDVSSCMNRLCLSSRADIQKSTASSSSHSAFASTATPATAGVLSNFSALTSVASSIRDSARTSAISSSSASVSESAAVPSSQTELAVSQTHSVSEISSTSSLNKQMAYF